MDSECDRKSYSLSVPLILPRHRLIGSDKKREVKDGVSSSRLLCNTRANFYITDAEFCKRCAGIASFSPETARISVGMNLAFVRRDLPIPTAR